MKIVIHFFFLSFFHFFFICSEEINSRKIPINSQGEIMAKVTNSLSHSHSHIHTLSFSLLAL